MSNTGVNDNFPRSFVQSSWEAFVSFEQGCTIVVGHCDLALSWEPTLRSFVRVSIRDGATGSGFAIQDILFLPLKSPDTPEGGVRGACSSGALRHTKHRDRLVHPSVVLDSFECKEVIPASRIRACPPMPVH